MDVLLGKFTYNEVVRTLIDLVLHLRTWRYFFGEWSGVCRYRNSMLSSGFT